jgi:hypothetical protein
MKIPAKYLGETDEETKAKMPDRMIISLKGKTTLYKNEIMMLDLIAHCNWERPLYIATTVPSSSYLGLGNYFLLEGLAYRITPFDWKVALGSNSRSSAVDSDRMYENLMNFRYGGLDKPNVYLDETNRRMCMSQRRLTAQVAIELYNEGKRDKALAVLESIEAGISDKVLPLNDATYGSSSEFANIYLALGKKERAAAILVETTENNLQVMRWYMSMNNRNLRRSKAGFSEVASIQYSYVFPLMEQCLDKAVFDEYYAEWQNMCDSFESRLN